MSRELTEAEREAVDAAYHRYLEGCETAEQCHNATIAAEAWAEYLDTLHKMGVFPSLAGYRIKT